MKSLKPKNNVPINLKKIKRVVIKVGSNILANEKGVRQAFFKSLAQQVHYLKSKNIQTVIVSSGAIATAMAHFQVTKKPNNIAGQQAYAAIGQPILMNFYTKAFKKQGLSIGQILLTQDCLENRQRFLNAKHALKALLKDQVIPIVNENDSVAVDEIRIGDNDQLSAHVAHLIEADLLIILSHVNGLYEENPQLVAKASLIPLVKKIDKNIQSFVTDNPSQRTTGGMQTKLMAAKYCMDYGIPVLITSGFKKEFAVHLYQNKLIGTWFVSDQKVLSARKHWIGNIWKAKGKIVVDHGAKKALEQQRKSLLPAGILSVQGQFQTGDCVEIIDHKGKGIAKGLVSYAKEDIVKIKGMKTSEINKILGYQFSAEVVHRDDLVLENKK